jgi:hypothetical protein
MTALFDITQIGRDLPPPAATRTSARKTHRVSGVVVGQAKASARLVRLASMIPTPLEQGTILHVVSHADWNVAELLTVLLDNFSDPAELHLSTWSTSDAQVRRIATLKEQGRLSRVVALFDVYAARQKQAAFSMLRTLADSWAMRAQHSKVYVLISDAEQIGLSVVTSGNLTSNRRIEAGTVTADYKIAVWHRKWIADAIANAPPFDEPEERT